MDTTAIVVVVILAVVIIILAFRYKDRIRFGLKGPLGTGLDFEGQNPRAEATQTATSEAGKSAMNPARGTGAAMASGERSVAFGGDAGGTIVTGDQNKVG